MIFVIHAATCTHRVSTATIATSRHQQIWSKNTFVYELVSVPLIRYQTPPLSPLKSLAKLSLLVLSCKQGLVCQNQWAFPGVSGVPGCIGASSKSHDWNCKVSETESHVHFTLPQNFFSLWKKRTQLSHMPVLKLALHPSVSDSFESKDNIPAFDNLYKREGKQCPPF